MAKQTTDKRTIGRKTKDQSGKDQELAKLYYLKENLTQKEIAEKVNVTEATISKWIEKFGWEKLKRNFILTREEQLALMYSELEEINNAIKNKPEGQRYADNKEADIRTKLRKDIKELETKAMLPETISAITQFIDRVRKENLEHAKLISVYADDFIKSKLR